MKKILIAFLFIFTNAISQNLNIEYNVTENTNDPILSTSINYSLILTKKKSIFFNSSTDSLKQFKYQHLIFDVNKIGELTKVKITDNHYAFVKQDYFYKDYEKDTLIFNEIIINKKIIVGEKINLFEWEIEPKSDTLILGFKSQKAISKFRGRTYEVYFTTEIAPYGGPWKFDGLPGLIISARSTDGYLVIEPKKIINNFKEKIEIQNIYINEKVISWEQFKLTYENKLREQLKKLKSLSENGEGGSIKITDKIEDLEIPEMTF